MTKVYLFVFSVFFVIHSTFVFSAEQITKIYQDRKGGYFDDLVAGCSSAYTDTVYAVEGGGGSIWVSENGLVGADECIVSLIADPSADIEPLPIEWVSDMYFLHEPNTDQQSDECVGNPVDPVSGKKYQYEKIIDTSSRYSITFSLYFNSHRQEKWRHTYSRTLNIVASSSMPRYDFTGQRFGLGSIVPESSAGLGFPVDTMIYGRFVMAPLGPVSYYRDTACVTGWSSFKSNYHYSWAASSTAQYAGNGHCEIYANGVRKMILSVYGRSSGRAAEIDIKQYLRFTRENGTVVTFIENVVDNSWDNLSNTGEWAETIYAADGVTVTGYRYFTQIDEIEEYDTDGKLLAITSVDGHKQTLIYSPATSMLMRVENEIGKYIEFIYETFGGDNQYYRIQSITEHTGRSWGFRYDTNGNLEFVDNPDTTSRQYHYDDPEDRHLLSGITDERNIRYATWKYNTDKKAISSAHGELADKDVVIIDYGVNGKRTITKKRTSSVTGLTEDIDSIYTSHTGGGRPLIAGVSGPGCSSCGNGQTISEYDAETGYLIFRDEHGVRTEYGNYDSKGNPGCVVEGMAVTDDSSRTISCAFDPVLSPDARRKDSTYDPRFHSKIATITESSVFAGASKVTTFTYDEFGNAISVTIDGYKPDGTAVSRTTTYQYDGPYHQLSQIDGPRTDVSDIINFEYYANSASEGNNRARLRLVRGSDGTVFRSNIIYTATGKVASESRPNGLTLTYSYYPGNDRLEILTETDSLENRETHWAYLPTGEVQTVTTGYNSVDATIVTLDYDDARRLTKITDGLGNYIEYILDSDGNVEKENIYDVNGYLKKTLTQTFDSYNRLDNFSEKNHVENNDFNADGTLDKTTDGKDVVTDYSYDSLKRLTQVIQDQGGTDPTTANALTQYGYDVQDNLVFVTDANNGQTSYIYDDLGNLISQTSPDTGTTVFTHDEAGNISTQIDAKGQLFSYSYDYYNRLILLDAPGVTDDVTYTYDTCTGGYGRLCEVTRNNSTTSYQYNAMGDVVNVDQNIITWAGYNQATNGVAYSYDQAGRVKTMTYPSGAVVTYAYDAAGQVSSMVQDHNGTQTHLLDITARFPFGAINNATFGNAQTYFGYVHEDYRNWIVAGAGQYTTLYYDQNGNPTTMHFPQGQSIQQYDTHQRLDAVFSDLGEFDYTYDMVGNKTQYVQDGTTFDMAYDANTNRMNTLDGESIVLDANGNTTNLRGMTLSYTADNRLKMTNTGVLLDYNGLGQRTVKKTTAPGIAGTYGYSQSVVYLYGLNGELLAEMGPTGNVVKEYIYLDGQPLAMLQHTPNSGENFLNGDIDGDGSISVEDFLVYYFNDGSSTDPAYDVNGDGVKDGADTSVIINCGLTQGNCEATSYSASIYYIHNDHLGTPKLMTNEAGIPVWRATATPFGKAGINNDVDGDGETVTLNLRQPGQYYDRETGLYYNYYRYYDPETGRYITADPLGVKGLIDVLGDDFSGQHTNLYSYVLNNPLLYIDPYGLFDLNKFLKKTAVATAINTALGAKVLGVGAALDPRVTGCQTMNCPGAGDGDIPFPADKPEKPFIPPEPPKEPSCP